MKFKLYISSLLIALSIHLSRSWKSRSCPSIEVLKPKSGPVCPSICRSCPFSRSNCRRRCYLYSSFWKSPSSHGYFSSQLIATTGARYGVCLDFCFTLILCFLFVPYFTAVEISSFVLESTSRIVSLFWSSDLGCFTDGIPLEGARNGVKI